MRLFLVDGSYFIFRAYHSVPALFRADGLQTNAVYGFCKVLMSVLDGLGQDEPPTHMAVVFDSARHTFRNDLYPGYKANRAGPPTELAHQFALCRAAVKAFGIATVEQRGFEADDVIASYAKQATAGGGTTTIVSCDKDLMQLVDHSVTMFDTMKNCRIGVPEVFDKFGVTPDKVIEVQALIGDPTDNIPGCPGIGVKTAAELINLYGDLETLLEHAGEIKQPGRRNTLLANGNVARLSKRLVTLDKDVQLDVHISALAVKDVDYGPIMAFLGLMEFPSLMQTYSGFMVLPADNQAVG